MSWIDRINRINRRFAKRRVTCVSHWDQVGLHTANGDRHIDIPWERVRQVHAYKKDCFTVDQIRLIFSATEHLIEFTEDGPAFSELCTTMEQKLQISPEWRLHLYLAPAFEPTLTCVYGKDSARVPGQAADAENAESTSE